MQTLTKGPRPAGRRKILVDAQVIKVNLTAEDIAYLESMQFGSVSAAIRELVRRDKGLNRVFGA